MDKRYQVFVSSTYADLKEERQEIMHALLELDCIPAGMELFPAADEDQWTLIKRVIDECDYYIVILGGRYGSCDSSGMSYTEKEYRYAIEKGKPTIAFLHKEPGSIPASKTEKTDKGKKKLGEFKLFLEEKMCKYWITPKDLGGIVSRSLIKLRKDKPAVGWVRADQIPDKSTIQDNLLLRKHIDELETQLKQLSTEPPKETEQFAQGENPFPIRYAYRVEHELVYMETGGVCKLTWNEIFSHIAPIMIDEASDYRIRLALQELIKRTDLLTLLKQNSGKHVSNFSISQDDFQTIIVQLRALELMTQGSKIRPRDDSSTYWKLTPHGDRLMTKLRAIRKPESKQPTKKKVLKNSEQKQK